MRPALLFLLCFAPAVAAPVPKAVKKQVTDTELLDGRWVSVTHDFGDGPKTTGDHYFEVNDGKLSTGTNGVPGYHKRRFTLDETTNPRQLDIDASGYTDTGIYHMDGDTLTWCRYCSTGRRPTEFKGGDGYHCFVFKRVKPKE